MTETGLLIVCIVLALFLFVQHWAIIKLEVREEKRTKLLYQIFNHYELRQVIERRLIAHERNQFRTSNN